MTTPAPTRPTTRGSRWRRSAQADHARRYLPVYRWIADIDDKTVAAVIGGGWAVWVLSAVLSMAMGAGAGAVVCGVVLAGVGVVVTKMVLSRWVRYRRSPAQLRHQILARDQIARARELGTSTLGADTVVKLGEHVRPVFTTTAADHGRQAALVACGQATTRVVTSAGPDGTDTPVHLPCLAHHPDTSHIRSHGA